jgi:hypothetical protein
MKKDKDLLPEYDFSNGVRGKYAKAYHASSNVVKIEPSLAKKFPNEKAVNKALRAYAKIAKA